jgi:hypothetical protein
MIELNISWCFGDNYTLVMNGIYINMYSTKKEAFEKATSIAGELENQGLHVVISD